MQWGRELSARVTEFLSRAPPRANTSIRSSAASSATAPPTPTDFSAVGAHQKTCAKATAKTFPKKMVQSESECMHLFNFLVRCAPLALLSNFNSLVAYCLEIWFDITFISVILFIVAERTWQWNIINCTRSDQRLGRLEATPEPS